MLQLLPALPPEDLDSAAPDPAPPAPPPHLVPLPTWSGWCLGIAPGRVSGRAAARPAPSRAPAGAAAPEEKAFRKRCRFCRDVFRDRSAYLYHPCKIATFEMVIFWDLVSETVSNRRKCSPFPRAKSRSFTKAARRREQKRREQAAQGALIPDAVYQRNRNLPVLREECKEGPRPCPLVSCRAHMAFTVNEENGSIKENYPHLRIYKNPQGPGLHVLHALYGSCSLDVADEIQAAMMGGAEGDGVPGLIALMRTALAGEPIGTTEGYTLEQTAKRMGLSLERIRQLGARALQDVRVGLRRALEASPGRRAS